MTSSFSSAFDSSFGHGASPGDIRGHPNYVNVVQPSTPDDMDDVFTYYRGTQTYMAHSMVLTAELPLDASMEDYKTYPVVLEVDMELKMRLEAPSFTVGFDEGFGGPGG